MDGVDPACLGRQSKGLWRDAQERGRFGQIEPSFHTIGGGAEGWNFAMLA